MTVSTYAAELTPSATTVAYANSADGIEGTVLLLLMARRPGNRHYLEVVASAAANLAEWATDPRAAEIYRAISADAIMAQYV